MKVLYFDCFSGISGDMTVGALLDLGIDVNELDRELSKLRIYNEFKISAKNQYSYGIRCTNFSVDVHNYGGNHGSGHGYEHSNNQAHNDSQTRNDNQDHINSNIHDHSGVRTYSDICGIIDGSELKESIKELARNIFKEIAAAEGRIHGKPTEEVHFHEVGAVDSIVDILAAAICIDMLNVDAVYSSPLYDGTGFIECAHGTLPVPVPAVAEMLNSSSIPVFTKEVNTELITPTGLGIIKILTEYFGKRPNMKIIKTGYGMGKKDVGSLNALRVFLGEISEDTDIEDTDVYDSRCKASMSGMDNADHAGNIEDRDSNETVTVIETNIDDSTGEDLGATFDRLFEEGALDVFFTPIFMKKNRPAYKLSVICEPENRQKCTNIILAYTSTIGLRYYDAKRVIMDREIENVETEYGPVRMKISTYNGITKHSFEYDDIKRTMSSEEQ